MAEIIYLGGNYMLENWIKPQIPEEEELDERLHAARSKLSVLQMQIKEHGLPVLVLFEGWGTAGKGSVLGKVIKNIDPRFFKVATMDEPTEEERRKPFLYRYFVKIPAKGKLEFLDSGWMDEVVKDVLHDKIGEKEYKKKIESVKRFERQLTDNGYLVMKFFFQISRKEQKKRIEVLKENKDTRWRVSGDEDWQNKHYDKCMHVFDRYLNDTNSPADPWYIVDAKNRKWAELQVLETLVSGIETALKNSNLAVPLLQNVFPLEKIPKLSEISLDKELSEEEYKKELKNLQSKLSELHNRLYRRKIPVVIAYEGWDAAGKGGNIKRITGALDPRGFDVYTGDKDTEEEALRPFLWRFAVHAPADGRITIYDTSWYRRVQADRFEGKLNEKKADAAFEDICAFERCLVDGGTVLIKFFLDISEKEQEKRFKKLLESKDTAWRVTEKELARNAHYGKYKKLSDEMIRRTDTPYAPWYVIDAKEKSGTALMVIKTVADVLEKALEKKRAGKEAEIFEKPVPPDRYEKGILAKADLTKRLEEAEYRKKLDKLQKRLEVLHGELYRLRIPVILGFEGWDAAGKGGAIKRLTSHLDPRGYKVCPTASPNDVEKSHHYLWRFWNHVPKAGHIAIFDRTWYGRVMVERIEGFCSEEDWHHAYREINEMEAHFVHSGALVLKFWLQIDKDEQERRFNDRMKNPEKRWKITDEDWRNREKWDAYVLAVNEMLEKTSTKDAPWIVVEGNSKWYARIKVLETVADAMEKKIKEVEKNRKR